MSRSTLKTITFLLALFFFSHGVFAATSALPFLRITPSARAVGMGETFTAIADSVDSGYWNPAGLASMETMDISLMHLLYWDTSSYEYAAFSYPLANKIKLGFHVIYMSYGAIEKTTEAAGGSIGAASNSFFTPYDLCFAASAGYLLNRNLQVGVTTKYVLQSIDTSSASTFAADAGILARLIMLDDNLLFGAALSNLGLQINGDNLPLTARGGFSYKFDLLEKEDITVAATAYYPFDTGKLAENIGAEFWYGGEIALRAGYKIGYDVGNFSAGLGYKSVLEGIFGYELDYAYAPSGNLGNTHRISLMLFLDDTRAKGNNNNKEKSNKVAPTMQERKH